MKYKEIKIHTTDDDADLVAYIAQTLGSSGEQITSYKDIESVMSSEMNWDYADDALLQPFSEVTVSAFFAEDFDESALKSALDEAGLNVALSAVCEDSSKWENEWKKYYKPTQFNNITIVPEWIKYTPKEKTEIVVRLNPGVAFGTGMHETTSMCINLMQCIDMKGKNVLDLGCGSGILGICALRLGADNCVFIDYDEQAIKATRENIALNDLNNFKVINHDVRSDGGFKADVVLANITADVLICMSDYVKAVTAKNGYIILSGIIDKRQEAVMAAYKDCKILRSVKKGEWHAFLLEVDG